MNYPYDVYRAQVETHAFWVAKSKVLNGCVGQGDSIEDAVEELQINEIAWIESAKEIGLSIPEIPIEHLSAYSGKLTLRISPYEHEKAAMLARKEGISLNQYISDAVVARNHEMMTVDYVSDNVMNLSRMLVVLASISGTNNHSCSRIDYSLAPKTEFSYLLER